jgi:hypothetical protein
MALTSAVRSVVDAVVIKRLRGVSGITFIVILTGQSAILALPAMRGAVLTASRDRHHARGMTGEPIGWIREVVLNAADPHALAEFWSRVVGGSPVEWYDGWVTLEPPPHGQRLSFQQSSTSPSDSSVHVDVLVEDLEAAHDLVVAAGAAYVREGWSPRPGPDGESVPWRVYTDPEGHAFCLVVR